MPLRRGRLVLGGGDLVVLKAEEERSCSSLSEHVFSVTSPSSYPYEHWGAVEGDGDGAVDKTEEEGLPRVSWNLGSSRARRGWSRYERDAIMM
jgi:hypothetical protein